jgi:LacI family transcriptional regulator
MVRKRKEVIGLVAIESRGPETDIEQDGLLFMEEVLRGVESLLSQVGWSVLISVLRSANRADAYHWLQKLSAKVDGMLIAEGIVPSQQLARLAARVPVTLVAGSPEEPHADVVHADNRAGTEALVGHMVGQHGKTRLHYVTGPPEAPDARERRSVFEQALARYPGVRLAGCFEGRFAAVSGQLAVRELLAARRRTCPMPSSAATTRWRSGSCGNCTRPGYGCRPTSPWPGSTTCTWAPCWPRP